MRGFIGGLVIGLVIGVVLAVTAPGSNTPARNGQSAAALTKGQIGKPVSWQLASAYPSEMPFSGSLGPTMIDRLKKISNGNITIDFHEPGALVPALDLFEAVASGTVDTALASSQFWGSKSPAFELFGSVPFGPDIASYLAWFRQHDGQKLYEDLYRRHNIHAMVCGVTGAAGAGWFEHAINEVKDLKELKIAASGLASRVYKHLGATTVQLAPADLQNALKMKKVDAVAFSTPAADQYLGLTEFSKHYYFPGWFQQAGFIDLMINLEKWNDLSKNQKKMVETACMANMEYSLAAGEAGQFEALKNIVIRGVDVKKFPPKLTKALKRAWLSIARSRAASDKDFRRVLKSLRKFREDYSIWQELGKI
ncbi:MAG: TRAP transporter substrate-binding protein DctP [Rhodospirillaceae bacterium]|jgi:TRAP-type mannitol/chloroaromatic compound transport system substrate-binding protein|nr:TRAP transporter substrate-binding protein DctP [Rhodospirillaceae bacterium]MBT4938123.1 TRAP transporter substrate-binding protein DctP [Rhodospirillaceae bacterium]MBT5939855.1 TRAP transporter substrate-binding protein DctP [Rhodospirillaceae bacterium]MBT7267649.1 TRAP transporter substrate-binding protein DctP [Rhodospirillaceae bacterium]